MKKRILALLLALALTVPVLCLPVQAEESKTFQASDRIGFSIPENRPVLFKYSGEELRLFDDQSNLLYYPVKYTGMWEPLEQPIPAETMYKSVTDDVRNRYSIRFEWDASLNLNIERKLSLVLNFLYCLEEVNVEFLETVGDWLNTRKMYFTVNAAPRGNGNMFAVAGFAKPTNYGAHIDSYVEGSAAHEYGHAIYYTVLSSKRNMRSEWIKLNGNWSYVGDGFGIAPDQKNPVCVTNYATTSYAEDVAETFCALFGHGVYFRPNSPVASKMSYLRQLLYESLSMGPEAIPQADKYIPSTWAADDIDEYRGDQGVGYNPTKEGWHVGATRADFAVSMAEITYDFGYKFRIDWEQYGLNNIRDMTSKSYIVENYPFTDTKYLNDNSIYSAGSRLENYIDVLYKTGIITGTSETTFSPEGRITRQEAATMIYRMCNVLGYRLPEGGLDFADADRIAPWAREAVAAMQAAGIMNGVGDNRFDPTGTYTYEQSVLSLLRVKKLLEAAPKSKTAA